MDKDADEMQHLGAGGILGESFKLIANRRYGRLLATLAALLVLPLSLVLLGHRLVTDPLMTKIGHNSEILAAEENEGSPYAARTRNLLTWEMIRLMLFLVLYLVFLLALSLVSTAAIVYSMACIYLDKQVGVRVVLEVVPKVWKRLMSTFLWASIIMLLYQVLFIVTLLVTIIAMGDRAFGMLLFLGIIFLAVHVYLNLVWHLASVITVLEEHWGIFALRKSLNLIKGKRATGFFLISIYMLFTGFISAWFHSYVVVLGPSDGASSWTSRIVWGVLLVLALTLVNLVGLLSQTLFYFSAKSYHHESIDRLLLSDQLDAYLGDYVPLKDPPAIALGTMRHDEGEFEV